jgi:hypothetical protein
MTTAILACPEEREKIKAQGSLLMIFARLAATSLTLNAGRSTNRCPTVQNH